MNVLISFLARLSGAFVCCVFMLAASLLLPRALCLVVGASAIATLCLLLSKPYSNVRNRMATTLGIFGGGFFVALALQIIDEVASAPLVEYSDFELLQIGIDRLLDLRMGVLIIDLTVMLVVGLVSALWYLYRNTKRRARN